MTKNTDVVFFNAKEKFAYIKNFLNNWQIKNDENFTEYDYMVFDTDGYGNFDEFLKISDEIILITEANLLGINNAKEILQFLINNLKTQKDNIKIVFNKHNIMSINLCILKKMFEDFKILGILHYDKNYNCFINSNAKILMPKIKKEFLKIIKKIN